MIGSVKGLTFSEPAARRVVNAVRWVEGRAVSPSGGEASSARGGVPQYFLAAITGWATLGSTGARWKYAWEQKLLDGDDDIAVHSGRRISGTTSDFYALNVCELNNVTHHTGTQGNSVDQSGADYPATFSIKPVGGGAGGTPANQVIVLMTIQTDANGNARPMFQYQNADDGTCS